MIAGYFPDVKTITTRIGKDGGLSDNAFADAAKHCDILVHSSGPNLVARRYIQAWRRHTQKPYGVFGITIEKITPEIRDIVENAAFFFTRETASLKILKREKIANPNCAFVPDATFSFDVADTKRAAEFFANADPKLDDGKFVCVVPRLRYTPYWKEGRIGYPKGEIARREKIMAERWEIDRAKILKIVEDIFENTDCKVLLCPEMTYQREMCAELFGLLKSKYAGRIGHRGYWLPDEAAAVYARGDRRELRVPLADSRAAGGNARALPAPTRRHRERANVLRPPLVRLGFRNRRNPRRQNFRNRARHFEIARTRARIRGKGNRNRRQTHEIRRGRNRETPVIFGIRNDSKRGASAARTKFRV